MRLLNPVLFLLVALAAGAALAVVSLAAGIPTGWIGALVLIGWAGVMRRRWARLEARDIEPGAPERLLWLRLAGVALVLGHLVAAIVLVRDDLRLGHGNSLGIDSWTMILGHLIATALFHRDLGARDERHAPIVARGIRVGYVTLIALEVPLLLWIGMTPLPWRILLTHFVLANAVIALMCASYAAMLLTQLIAYAKDAEETRAAQEDAPFP